MSFSSFAKRVAYYTQYPNKLPTVLVIYGGQTHEKAVSIESGQAVVSGLKAGGVEVLEYEVRSWQALVSYLLELKQSQAFVVFNLIHGGFGEDGALHALLDMLAIPYVGSDHGASSLSMNKAKCKTLWTALALNVPKTRMIGALSELDHCEDICFPCIVKPNQEGSSNGIFKVDKDEQLTEAVTEALRFDSQVLIEQYIKGRELTVAVVDDEALMPIEIIPANGLYDYHAKYVANDTQFFCPPKNFEKQQLSTLYHQAVLAYQAIGARHWGRVDFIMDEENKVWVLEVNLIPGMTSHSLVPQAAKAQGLSFSQLVCGLVSLV